ncbi:MAG: HAD family hydrolase, partial [bacterium]
VVNGMDMSEEDGVGTDVLRVPDHRLETVKRDRLQMPVADIDRMSFDVQRHRAWFSFDLTLKETSKGRGIKEICKALDFPIEDTIAFGDGRNDVEMLQTAHIGIAMGNAMKEALEAADYITDRIENQGITKACRHFGLIP